MARIAAIPNDVAARQATVTMAIHASRRVIAEVRNGFIDGSGWQK
jgi:hypothetical protein